MDTRTARMGFRTVVSVAILCEGSEYMVAVQIHQKRSIACKESQLSLLVARSFVHSS